MFKITVDTGNNCFTGEFENKILLSDAIGRLGINQHKPCGGRGVCKKCTVVANGTEVLACRTYISEDCYVNYNINSTNVQGLYTGFMPEFEAAPLVTQGYGAAIDIGTTTVAASIYSFPNCECVKAAALPNSQAKYGADVISRIMHSNEGGLKELQSEIIGIIKNLTEDFDIQKYVITGNTTMLHLLTGLSPEGIAVAPYIPQSLFGEWYKNAYLPKCISAYVGADITTAILASNITKHKAAFMVDIGTNGEMALWNNGTLTCCSTAAGPAFEGAGIEYGTLAVSGAINSVYIQNGEIKYTTIDDKSPVGICGTGLIDAIACMLEAGITDESGYLEQPFEIGDSKIYITPEDIRAVQLAKSAIRSGIDTLLHNSGTDFDMIEAFYIAGGFGSYINPQSAAKIGLIPTEAVSKAAALGNCALSGAAMILQSKACLEKSEQLAAAAKTTELASSPFFMEKYIDNMVF